MAYIKLNEVTLVETSVEPKILIEENGEIKRIPAENVAQVQSDWNETDTSKASFILNKPESLGGKVIILEENCGIKLEDGSTATAQYIVDEWKAGSILRYSSDSGSVLSNVLNVYYYENSGKINARLYYVDDCGSVSSLYANE